MRIMGKRQIGDMQPGELVITILISEIAAIPIQDLNQPILTGIVAVFTLVFLEVFVSVVAMKFYPLRRIFYGSSAIVIKEGEIDQKMLRRLRVTCPDLLEVLRNRDIFDVNEVAYAILETNGQLSVMLKPQFQNLSKGDVKECTDTALLPCLVICDGKLIKDEMKNINKTKAQLVNHLKEKNIALKDIFIMTCDQDMNCNIIKRENK